MCPGCCTYGGEVSTPLTDYMTILGNWYIDTLHSETITNTTIKNISNTYMYMYTQSIYISAKNIIIQLYMLLY